MTTKRFEVGARVHEPTYGSGVGHLGRGRLHADPVRRQHRPQVPDQSGEARADERAGSRRTPPADPQAQERVVLEVDQGEAGRGGGRRHRPRRRRRPRRRGRCRSRGRRRRLILHRPANHPVERPANHPVEQPPNHPSSDRRITRRTAAESPRRTAAESPVERPANHPSNGRRITPSKATPSLAGPSPVRPPRSRECRRLGSRPR